jgi:hypothetical protein
MESATRFPVLLPRMRSPRRSKIVSRTRVTWSTIAVPRAAAVCRPYEATAKPAAAHASVRASTRRSRSASEVSSPGVRWPGLRARVAQHLLPLDPEPAAVASHRAVFHTGAALPSFSSRRRAVSRHPHRLKITPGFLMVSLKPSISPVFDIKVRVQVAGTHLPDRRRPRAGSFRRGVAGTAAQTRAEAGLSLAL